MPFDWPRRTLLQKGGIVAGALFAGCTRFLSSGQLGVWVRNHHQESRTLTVEIAELVNEEKGEVVFEEEFELEQGASVKGDPLLPRRNYRVEASLETGERKAVHFGRNDCEGDNWVLITIEQNPEPTPISFNHSKRC